MSFTKIVQGQEFVFCLGARCAYSTKYGIQAQGANPQPQEGLSSVHKTDLSLLWADMTCMYIIDLNTSLVYMLEASLMKFVMIRVK